MSAVNLALAEQRKSGSIMSSNCDQVPECSDSSSRFELLRQRIVAKEMAAIEQVDGGIKPAVSAQRSLCMGKPSSNLSKLDALRQRIKAKELATKGIPHKSD